MGDRGRASQGTADEDEAAKALRTIYTHVHRTQGQQARHIQTLELKPYPTSPCHVPSHPLSSLDVAFTIRTHLQLRSGPRAANLGDLVVQQAGDEVRVVLAGDLAGEVLGREVELVALGRALRERVRLLAQQLQRVRLVDRLTLGGRDAVPAPLPELGAADFGRRCVFLHKQSVSVSFGMAGRWARWEATGKEK